MNFSRKLKPGASLVKGTMFARETDPACLRFLSSVSAIETLACGASVDLRVLPTGLSCQLRKNLSASNSVSQIAGCTDVVGKRK